ncbi:type III-A CRISPR-associated protein Csm2 [Desulfobulbus alkaliphilus]|uniref:type III-A CRISPR-associated protein Csm2 n=1 Tax=Desulfobulbus alkaliphilus TaxID=869814 RepID=UPI001965E5F1|nr:type III-A CRISPR-associated protein Csm2 [Desulfobulbus alkaliphilus]MBM9536299.1 type III-A CRISPR-associated protein Csm2 [Desulfobulbus alkaliphilus]
MSQTSMRRQSQSRSHGNQGQQNSSYNQNNSIVDGIYFGENIDSNLFADIAQAKAKIIAIEGGGRRNKSSQLRKFFDELVMWHDKVFAHGVDRVVTYKELAPYIKMLCAKVSYARGRDHVSEGFEKLFSHVIRAVNSPETLKQAKLFIEAFMGFYKAEEK